MIALGFLIPLPVVLRGVFAAPFVGSVKSGHWEDFDGAVRWPTEDDLVVPPR